MANAELILEGEAVIPVVMGVAMGSIIPAVQFIVFKPTTETADSVSRSITSGELKYIRRRDPGFSGLYSSNHSYRIVGGEWQNRGVLVVLASPR